VGNNTEEFGDFSALTVEYVEVPVPIVAINGDWEDVGHWLSLPINDSDFVDAGVIQRRLKYDIALLDHRREDVLIPFGRA